MRILILSYSDQDGGAAKAAYRLLEALNLKGGVYAEMWVLSKNTSNVNVRLITGRRIQMRLVINKAIERLARSILGRCSSGYGSLGIAGIPLAKKINNSDFDIVNLHWVQGGMLSINEISKITKPLAWTLHDMWTFSGFFHYTDRSWETYRGGRGQRFMDVDYRLWKAKVNRWQHRNYKVICPSSWMESMAKQSLVYGRSDLKRIGYAIDSEVWSKDQTAGVQALARRDSRFVKVRILFGAVGGLKDRRKGFDLLVKALETIKESTVDNNMMLLIAGQESGESEIAGVETVYLGKIKGEKEMVDALSKADIAVIPSRSDNLPNMAIEAQACMLPVVGFAIGGMPDIVEHKVTGYLAKDEDYRDLAEGIRFVSEMLRISDKMSRDSRMRAIEMFSYEKIAKETVGFFKSSIHSDGIHKWKRT